ncbi:MAG: A/G-specific adenine glycosylase, partial [Desulfovibrio sp.]|nr:A/G-specific adenine glycosylase [Desulfovibrio sp.]
MNSLQRTLLDWFAVNQRPLPWRGEYHPWHVLVAEIMGQQTQLERVAARLPEFLERFPTAAALAEASEEEVLKAWEGLGYYARARNLQAAAQALVERHGGEIPQDLEAVRA